MFKIIFQRVIIFLLSTLVLVGHKSVVFAEEDILSGEIAGQIQVYNATASHSYSSFSRTSAVYMRIKNLTNRDMRLVGATAAMVSNVVELHESFVDENGIARMSSKDVIVIPANSEIEMKPGGIHIMLIELKRGLKAEDKFILKLLRERITPTDSVGGAPVDVEVVVQ